MDANFVKKCFKDLKNIIDINQPIFDVKNINISCLFQLNLEENVIDIKSFKFILCQLYDEINIQMYYICFLRLLFQVSQFKNYSVDDYQKFVYEIISKNNNSWFFSLIDCHQFIVKNCVHLKNINAIYKLNTYEQLAECNSKIDQIGISINYLKLSSNEVKEKKSIPDTINVKDNSVNEIKKLKTLLLKIKKQNDQLKEQNNNLQSIKVEFDSYKESCEVAQKDLNIKIIELSCKLNELQNSKNILQSEFETKSIIKNHEFDCIKRDLEISIEKNNLLQQEYTNLKNINERLQNNSLHNSNDLSLLDESIEKNKNLTTIKELTEKHENSLNNISKLEEENKKLNLKLIENTRILNELTNNHELEKCMIKNEFTTEKSNLMDKINNYEDQIKNLQNITKYPTIHHDSNSSTIIQNDQEISHISDTYVDTGMNTTKIMNQPCRIQSENMLQKILTDTSLTYENDNYITTLNESLMSDLIDNESENNLLKEQINILKDEIRKLDRMKSICNFDIDSFKSLFINFIVSSPNERQLILTQIQQNIPLNDTELNYLKEYSNITQSGTISYLSNYLGKWF